MSDDLKLMMVMLTGQADDTQTCFNAVEAHYVNINAETGGTPANKKGGWEGVVYTKHPVKLDHWFGKGVMFAEIEEPQGICYIYPPGEAVDANKLISKLSILIKEEFPAARAIYHFTAQYASFPHVPDCTFVKEFSSHWGGDENKVIIDRSSYRPGNVIDIVINKEGSSLFTSIFVGVGVIKYRLSVLGEFIPDEEVKDKMNHGIHNHKDDRIVDEGELEPGGDSVADAAKIIKWMRAAYRNSLKAQRIELFADYDSAEYFEAVDGILKAVGVWRNEKRHLAGQAADHFGGADPDLSQSSAYADAAYSHVAVGALAPFFEGMFTHEFRLLRKYCDGRPPLNGHHRWKLKSDDFWNPHIQSENGEAKQGENVQRGSRQLLEALNLLKNFPEDFSDVTDALFIYRNRSLHMGYDWLLEKRMAFKKLLAEKKWEDKWFSVVLSEKTAAGGDFVPLLFSMTDKLIERCISLGQECVTAFYNIRDEKLGKPDAKLDPILRSFLLNKW